MSFLQPVFFWAATLIVPLAAIYFLKVRPRKNITTAIFLWQKIYQQKQRSSLLSRLRDILSLLLMVIVFTLLILAMAGPEFVTEDGKDLLIIIDNSISMATMDGSGTRLDKAGKQAGKIIAAMAAGNRAAVATVADQIDYKSYLTDNSRQLMRAIDAIEQTEIPFNPEALETIAGLRSSQSRIILLSDGAAFTDINDLNQDKSRPWFDENNNDPNSADGSTAGIELIRIGDEAENLGIVSCDLQKVVTQNGQMSFYCQLANSGQREVETQLLLYYIEAENSDQIKRLEEGSYDQLTGILLKAIPVTIKPGLNEPMIFNLAQSLAWKYIALLDFKDSMAKDNIAYLYINEPDPIKIGVLNAQRYFFEHCIQAFSQSTGLVELIQVSSSADSNSAKVLLAEGADLDQVYSGSESEDRIAAIIFDPNGESDFWTLTGNKLNDQEIVPRLIDKDHPAVRYYDPTSIQFYGAKEVTIPVDGQVLLETDTGVALIWRVNRPDRDIFVINMDPSQGDFYYNPFFPVMIYRMALSLAGKEKIETSTYMTNDLIPEYIRKNSEIISVTDPYGYSTGPLPTDQAGNMNIAGFYTFHREGQTEDLACSVLNAAETLVNGSVLETNARPMRKGQSPAYWLILLAIAAAAAESILYHRRKVG